MNEILQSARERFIKEFCNDHNGKIRFLRGIFMDDEDEVEQMMNNLNSELRIALKSFADGIMEKVINIKQTKIINGKEVFIECDDNFAYDEVLSIIDKELEI